VRTALRRIAGAVGSEHRSRWSDLARTAPSQVPIPIILFTAVFMMSVNRCWWTRDPDDSRICLSAFFPTGPPARLYDHKGFRFSHPSLLASEWMHPHGACVMSTWKPNRHFFSRFPPRFVSFRKQKGETNQCLLQHGRCFWFYPLVFIR
jgi:hypothetical protein